MSAVVRCEAPSYLDLLNRISVNETYAGRYLTAWADVTPDPCLAETLRLVAARETSHGEVFCRRVAELGGRLECCPDIVQNAAARLAVVADPKVSDLEKVGPARDEPDPFDKIERQMAEGVFDPLTAHMLTWYIAEERDTIERLQDAYAAVRAQAKAPKPVAPQRPAGPSADAEAIMACMTEGFARLEKSVEKLAKAVK
jgi:hypothetical protein